MYKVTKEFSFEAAHMINGHFGKCNNLHGHSYKLIVGLRAKKLNSEQVVIDFYHIKKEMNQLISLLDHAFLFNKNDEIERSLAKLLREQKRKVFGFKNKTTSENMSFEIQKFLKKIFKNFHVYVEIKETSSASGVYYE